MSIPREWKRLAPWHFRVLEILVEHCGNPVQTAVNTGTAYTGIGEAYCVSGLHASTLARCGLAERIGPKHWKATGLALKVWPELCEYRKDWKPFDLSEQVGDRTRR